MYYNNKSGYFINGIAFKGDNLIIDKTFYYVEECNLPGFIVGITRYRERIALNTSMIKEIFIHECEQCFGDYSDITAPPIVEATETGEEAAKKIKTWYEHI